MSITEDEVPISATEDGHDTTVPSRDPEGLRSIVREALERRRRALVFGIAQKLSSRFGDVNVSSGNGAISEVGEWTQIESLSQLRAVVGGRFQNLKEKWVGAGFPLREHRGDRAGQVTVAQAGWVDLSLWISKQGFETKLASPDEKWLFEVRKL